MGVSLPEMPVSRPVQTTDTGCREAVQNERMGRAGYPFEESTMEESIRQALAQDRTIDITTIGRRSGLPRRIETWFYRVEDQI